MLDGQASEILNHQNLIIQGMSQALMRKDQLMEEAALELNRRQHLLKEMHQALHETQSKANEIRDYSKALEQYILELRMVRINPPVFGN